MLGRTTGGVLLGIDAHLVEVEVALGGGIPTIAAVGLPDAAVREGIDRIRAALRHVGLPLPVGRITVNLAPADLRKHGASLDLPIAVALLVADGQLPARDEAPGLLAGELGLDGGLRSVPGVLSLALAGRAAGQRRLFVPGANADEATLVSGIEVVPVDRLTDLVAWWRGERTARPDAGGARRRLARELAGAAPDGPDLAEVRGQAAARRCLEISAAGAHHLLLCGPPGAGKTMLARRLPGILPPLGVDEALAVTRVWSAAGLVRGLVARRPFRAPHHGVSMAGMTGGGARLRPGELSLASHGVLYLDELPEFRRDVLEALRQPLEDGTIAIVRIHASVTLPATFCLVAAMNPCRCGHHGSPDGRCSCTPSEVRRYRAKLSGPLLDRFDLVCEVPALEPTVLADLRPSEGSAAVRTRVVAARERQRGRFGRSGPTANARMGPRDLERHARLDDEGRRLLLAACERLGVTARGFDRVRRVARTIADLEGCATIEAAHVAEALQYRHPHRVGRD